MSFVYKQAHPKTKLIYFMIHFVKAVCLFVDLSKKYGSVQISKHLEILIQKPLLVCVEMLKYC